MDAAEHIELGDGVYAVYTTVGAHSPGGLIEYHRTPDGFECGGSVLFDLDGIRHAYPDRAVWTVEQWEPLTLAPSILCRRCGHHGWIRGGTWERA